MRTKVITVDAKIARVAGRQKGNVTRAQLLDAGLSADAVKRRVAKGSLLPKHRGVYRVGHAAPSVESDYMAAVLACGEGAVVSGRAAAHLQGLVRGAPPPPEVTAPSAKRVAGIKTRRGRPPGTIIARTLVDLAAVLTEAELARACHEAGVRYGTTPRQVEAVMPRNAAGTGALRRVLRGDTRVTLSRLEERFLQLLEKNGLPLPRTNVRRGRRRVDCHWPGLTVELDSYRFHASRHAWEQDRRREREARARGDEFRRYTWGDVFETPRAILRELTLLLLRR